MIGDLTPAEARVVGCLIEKEATTPDNYPLTLNSLLNACNQTSNRNPVVSYDEAVVSDALQTLRERSLTRIVHSVHNRATKYRHVLDEVLDLSRQELALLAVLLLRGAQTVGELRTRTERLAPFDSLDQVEQTLDALAARDEPLVIRLSRQPGQKEARWAHLLSGEPEAETPAPASEDELTALRAEVVELRAEVARLQAQLVAENPA